MTDETIAIEDLQRIHRLVEKFGIVTPQNRLAERESALAAYVIFSAEHIAEIVRVSGAPPKLVRWIKDEVTARLLVVIQAQQLAHFQLWRDFMGDPATETEPPNESKGNDHGAE